MAMTPRTAIRIALGYLALVSVSIGVWALLAPQSFYDDYPGVGRVTFSAGRNFDTGSVNCSTPSSTSIIAATEANGLDIE